MRKRLKKKRVRKYTVVGIDWAAPGSDRTVVCVVKEVLPSLSFLQRIFLERLEEVGDRPLLISSTPRYYKPNPIGHMLATRGLSDLPPGTLLITEPLLIMQPSPEKVDAMFERFYNSLRPPR